MVIFLDTYVIEYLQLLFNSQICELPLLIGLGAANIFWVVLIHKLSKKYLRTIDIYIQFILKLFIV